MRAHDIVILFKIVIEDSDWFIKDAANEFFNRSLDIICRFIIEQLKQIKDPDKFQGTIIDNLYYDTSEERSQHIMNKIDYVLAKQ